MSIHFGNYHLSALVTQPVRIGVLALQGAYLEHLNMLEKINQLGLHPVIPFPIKSPEDLSNADGLILPGGESTTIALLAQNVGLLEPLRAFVKCRPTWGTCAGLILLSKSVHHTKQGGQPILGVMDVEIARNAYTHNFCKPIQLPMFDSAFPGIFIRAPVILRIGENVQLLSENDFVAVRQGHLIGTTFHPELTDDMRFHLYFLSMVDLFRSHNSTFE